MLQGFCKILYCMLELTFSLALYSFYGVVHSKNCFEHITYSVGKYLCILCVYFVLVASVTYYHTVCEGEPNIWERSLATATITPNVVTFFVCDPQCMKHEQYSLTVVRF